VSRDAVVDFKSLREVPITEGDEVIVAGAGDFTELNVIYRNITRSLGIPELDMEFALRRVFALGLMLYLARNAMCAIPMAAPG
jgi:hypothetical protein